MSANEKRHRTQPSASMDYANIAVSVKIMYLSCMN